MAATNPAHALAYLRTSSAANVDGDSSVRQRVAIQGYAKGAGLQIVGEFYDAAVSGADQITTREGFLAMLDRIEGNGVRLVIIESADRFARDLMVQEAGVVLLQQRGVRLVTANGDDLTDSSDPARVMLRQVLGSFAEFEKARLVHKLRGARDRASAAQGKRVEGAKATLTGDALAMLKRLRRRNPITKQQRSLRDIARLMAEAGHVSPRTGKPYSAQALLLALGRREPAPPVSQAKQPAQPADPLA